MDVDAWGLIAEPRCLLDVTVCAPFAERYSNVASAVEAGEERKCGEYAPAGGLHVRGVAVDVFGRMGPALSDLLEHWADLARQRDLMRGLTPRRWMHTWRAQISATVARGIARLIVTADVGTWPSRPHEACMLSPPTCTAATAPSGDAPTAVASQEWQQAAAAEAIQAWTAEEEVAEALHGPPEI